MRTSLSDNLDSTPAQAPPPQVSNGNDEFDLFSASNNASTTFPALNSNRGGFAFDSPPLKATGGDEVRITGIEGTGREEDEERVKFESNFPVIESSGGGEELNVSPISVFMAESLGYLRMLRTIRLC